MLPNLQSPSNLLNFMQICSGCSGVLPSAAAVCSQCNFGLFLLLAALSCSVPFALVGSTAHLFNWPVKHLVYRLASTTAQDLCSSTAASCLNLVSYSTHDGHTNLWLALIIPSMYASSSGTLSGLSMATTLEYRMKHRTHIAMSAILRCDFFRSASCTIRTWSARFDTGDRPSGAAGGNSAKSTNSLLRTVALLPFALGLLLLSLCWPGSCHRLAGSVPP